MEKPEAIRRISRRLRTQFATGLSWSQFSNVIGGLNSKEKAELLGSLRLGNAEAAGNVLLRQIRNWAQTQAEAEATSLLADDAISLAELDKVI